MAPPPLRAPIVMRQTVMRVASPRDRNPQLRPYRRMVAALRHVLPALALLVTMLVLAWPRFFSADSQLRILTSGIPINDVQTLHMDHARFVGTDERNRPFSLMAEAASQVDATADAVDLTKPQADMTLEDRTWSVVSARTGTFHRGERLLDLAGDVRLYHDSGNEIRTSAAQINFAYNSAYGTRPVVFSGPSGTITGQGFLVIDRGDRVLFTGKSQVVLRQPLKKG